jgi:hypothetical protein
MGEVRSVWYGRTTRINVMKAIKTMYGIMTMIICSTVADASVTNYINESGRDVQRKAKGRF